MAKIETSDTYEKGLPKQGGLSDLRMGTMDKGGAVCVTDGADLKDCPGYFGHIELAKPMYHCGFIKTVIRVLRCVSYHTSRLLIDKVSACAEDWAVGRAWGACACMTTPHARMLHDPHCHASTALAAS